MREFPSIRETMANLGRRREQLNQRLVQQGNAMCAELHALFLRCDTVDPVTERPYVTVEPLELTPGCKVTLFNNHFLHFAVTCEGRLKVTSSFDFNRRIQKEPYFDIITINNNHHIDSSKDNKE